jgi:hypothetical protein
MWVFGAFYSDWCGRGSNALLNYAIYALIYDTFVLNSASVFPLWCEYLSIYALIGDILDYGKVRSEVKLLPQLFPHSLHFL